jgi:nitroreductase
MENPVIELLRKRHASRSFLPDPLPEAIVADLIEAARLTPSCLNNQPWRYLFLASPEGLTKGRNALSRGNLAWAGRAPLLVVAYTREADDCTAPDGRRYHQFDLGMATMNLMLAATAHGLIARPMMGFSPERLRERFPELEAPDQPLVMIAIGFLSENEDHLPAEKRGMDARPRVRKEASEIVRRW